MTAECRLLKKTCSKFVVLHFMNVFLPQSTFAGETVSNCSRIVVMQKISHGNNKEVHAPFVYISDNSNARSLSSTVLTTASPQPQENYSSLWTAGFPLLAQLLSASFSFSSDVNTIHPKSWQKGAKSWTVSICRGLSRHHVDEFSNRAFELSNKPQEASCL